MSNQSKEEQSHPVAMLGCEWSIVCIHETNVLRVLGPFHNLGTARKPLSKKEQYSEQSTGNEDYDSSNKLRNVIGSEVYCTLPSYNQTILVEPLEYFKVLFCSAATINRKNLE